MKLNPAAAQDDELLFFTVTVKLADVPATILVIAGERLTDGLAGAQAATTVSVAVELAALPPAPESVAVTETAKAPGVAPAVSVSVAVPVAPAASESDATEKVPLKPAG